MSDAMSLALEDRACYAESIEPLLALSEKGLQMKKSLWKAKKACVTNVLPIFAFVTYSEFIEKCLNFRSQVMRETLREV